MLIPKLGITKPYDWAFVFCALVFLLQPQVFFNRQVWTKNKNVVFFLFIMVMLLINSIFFVKAEVSISIRVFRSYCFLITLLLFVPLPEEDYKKVFRIIVYFTSLASFIYCLQPILGRTLLTNVIDNETVILHDSSIPRYFNIPVFIFPVIFIFFFSKDLLRLRFHWLLAALNTMVFILCQHRSLFMSIIFCFVLNLLLSQKVKLVTIVTYIIIGSGILLIADNMLEGRFTQGFHDISDASFKVKDVTTIDFNDLPQLSTSEFRYYHFVERLLYVLKDTKRTLFGIGLVTEDSKIAKTLSFTVGTSYDDNSMVPQIATGDIAWSPLVLNIGFIGIVSFLILFIGFMKRFLLLRKNDLIKIGIYFIICLFITSFYSTLILQPYNLCMVMFFAAYSYHLKMKKDVAEPEGFVAPA